MSLIGYSLCIFFTLIILTSTAFIFLIFSNFLRNSKLEKQLIKTGFSRVDQRFLREDLSSYVFSNKYSNISSNDFLESFHKNRLISKLRRSEFDISKYFMFNKEVTNLYNVRFKGKKNSLAPNVNMLCDIGVSLLFNPTESDSGLVFIEKKLNEIFEINTKSKIQTNCAIVSNSGSLSDSNLGQEIDSHDIVMRFNNAPTLGYERDVGSKTSIRFVNSQLLLKEKFNISSSDLYRTRLKFVWDASDYDSDHNKWFNKSHRFFNSYKRVVQMFPNETFPILEPKTIWKSWDLLQSTTSTTIPKNPPTSGFLGIIILLKICSKLDIYEYIPSTRITDKCHYYDQQIDRGCTFGNW